MASFRSSRIDRSTQQQMLTLLLELMLLNGLAEVQNHRVNNTDVALSLKRGHFFVLTLYKICEAQCDYVTATLAQWPKISPKC